MDLVASIAQLLAYLGLGLALALPRYRRLVVAVLLAAAAIGIADGLLAPGERTLTTVHHYAGYEGAALEVSMCAFPTGTATAAGWLWPLPFAGFAVLWSAVLLGLGSRQLKSPLLLPLLFAWTATAAWLGMQKLAAPAVVVQPAGLERCLWPAGMAMALLVARTASGIFALTVTVSAAVVAARLPAALFSKLATDAGYGTSLDVSRVVDIVNPMTHMMFDPPLEPGSGPHQFWLIWLEHVIMYPALHSLGLFGIALGVYLWHKHSGDPE